MVGCDLDTVDMLAELNNRAENIKEDGREYENETELNLTGLEKAVTVADGRAKEVIRSVYEGQSENLSVNASNRGLSVAVEASNGRVMSAVEREGDESDTVNISVDEAVNTVREQSDATNLSVGEAEVDDGIIEVELEGENRTVEAEVDGSSGVIVELEMEADEGEPPAVGRPDDIPPSGDDVGVGVGGEDDEQGEENGDDDGTEGEDEEDTDDREDGTEGKPEESDDAGMNRGAR